MIETAPSLLILAAAALAALLVPPPAGGRRPFLLAVLLTGAGGGALLSRGALQSVLVGAAVLLLLWLCRTGSAVRRAWGIAVYALALPCLVVAALAEPPASAVATLIASAALLPLFPMHGGYFAAVAAAPGAARILAAAAAPIIGLHALLSRLQDLPPPALSVVGTLALAGAVYGSLKALVQTRAIPLLTYAALAFFSMLWWYLAAVPMPTRAAVLYGGAVALVMGGLLLAWRALQERYGDLALDQIGGLARPMPRFAFLFALLTMAAMGLPPFGVFAGYMAMLLTPLLAPSAGLIIVLLAWLAASWYLLTLLQRLLFGRHRPDLLYDDLRPSETASLAIVLAGLLALGLWPDGDGTATSARTPAPHATGLTWNR